MMVHRVIKYHSISNPTIQISLPPFQLEQSKEIPKILPLKEELELSTPPRLEYTDYPMEATHR